MMVAAGYAEDFARQNTADKAACEALFAAFVGLVASESEVIAAQSLAALELAILKSKPV